jgi:hypothetical protein
VQIVFFFAVKTLEGLPHKLPDVLREQYVKTVLVGYLLWPLAHIINFRFIPADLRILYVNWYAALSPQFLLIKPVVQALALTRKYPGDPTPAYINVYVQFSEHV